MGWNTLDADRGTRITLGRSTPLGLKGSLPHIFIALLPPQCHQRGGRAGAH
jgi:hypothetical protein